MNKSADRVFRITTFYGKGDPARWIEKEKLLFDNEKNFLQNVKLCKRKVDRRKTGIFQIRFVAEEFLSGGWVNIECYPKFKTIIKTTDTETLQRETKRKEKWVKINQQVEEEFRQRNGLEPDR